MDFTDIVIAAGGVGVTILLGAHWIATALRSHHPMSAPARPPSPSHGQENDPMPVGPATKAILDGIAPRFQSALSSGIAAGVTSSMAAISSSLADVAGQDDADTAAELDTDLTAAGLPPAAA